MTYDRDLYDDASLFDADDLAPEDRDTLSDRLDFLLAAEEALDNADDEMEFRNAAFALRAAEHDAALYH